MKLWRSPTWLPERLKICREQLAWHEESWDVPEEQGKNLMLAMTEKYYTMLYQTMVHHAPLEATLEQVRQRIAVIEECHRPVVAIKRTGIKTRI
ncbi:hypothetical protein [Paenibacillus piri]|uniref:Uncharacterized protein n=1 Tax=Paenibacillus piri TaxID=2547395 RepID=A0A4R5KHB3_9BACL|nr:hypothetical protein [Paenibacillus piri]TDF94442.1 hypothetical protein E1757_23830 [Paenibacillus piri]